MPIIPQDPTVVTASLSQPSDVREPQSNDDKPHPISVEELRLLADAWQQEFPELHFRTPADVLARWRRIADRHHLVVERSTERSTELTPKSRRSHRRNTRP